MSERDLREPIVRLMDSLGHPFADRSILLQALTHRSFVNECADRTVGDNERLEFLGDAVINLIVATALMERYPEAREGALSRMRAGVVSETGLARLARELDLGEALRLGRGEELSGGRERSSLLSDAFEAVIAAVYLDAGFERASAVLLPRLPFPSESDRPQGDPKTELQERLQGELHQTPTYRVIDENGPDHNKTFVVEIGFGEQVLGQGQGRTKKEAEQQAARGCLARWSEVIEEARAFQATGTATVPSAAASAPPPAEPASVED